MIWPLSGFLCEWLYLLNWYCRYSKPAPPRLSHLPQQQPPTHNQPSTHQYQFPLQPAEYRHAVNIQPSSSQHGSTNTGAQSSTAQHQTISQAPHTWYDQRSSGTSYSTSNQAASYHQPVHSYEHIQQHGLAAPIHNQPLCTERLQNSTESVEAIQRKIREKVLKYILICTNYISLDS